MDLRKGERRVPGLHHPTGAIQAGQVVADDTPAVKQRTVLLSGSRRSFGAAIPAGGAVIAKINPILRGWVNYFRIGNAARCFAFVKDWVERKVQRHLMRARNRPGFGWKRWSRAWLYPTLRLFNDYRVRHGPRLNARPDDRSHNPRREVQESGVREIRSRRLMWRGLETGRRGTAPALDPTVDCFFVDRAGAASGQGRGRDDGGASRKRLLRSA